MKVFVCHVSGRISSNPKLTEQLASEMADIIPDTIFFFETNEDD